MVDENLVEAGETRLGDGMVSSIGKCDNRALLPDNVRFVQSGLNGGGGAFAEDVERRPRWVSSKETSEIRPLL